VAEARLSTTERFLCLFTEVRPGEGRTAALMFVNVFLILCAYYFIKPLREGWIAVSGVAALTKMEVKAYSSFGQSLLLVFIVTGYARLADRWTRSELITWATLFCMSNMIVFWFLQPGFFIEHLPGTGIVFYLWVGVFGVFVVAQFWAFAADLYTDERGRRLFPMIAIGATGGAVAGSWLTESLVASELFGTRSLLLVALVPLAASVYLTRIADRRGPTGGGTSAPEKKPDGAVRHTALGLVFGSRFLLAVAVITLLVNWVNTNGENLLFRVVQEHLEHLATGRGITDEEALLAFTRDGTTAFYGGFFLWVNVVALVLQAFVASRLLKYGGFGALLLTMPVVALLSYGAMALIPVLAIVKVMKIAENSTDYSINNTARNVLWLPTTSEMKYKGKPTVDTFFVRIGDGMAALTVLVGVQLLTLTTAMFSVLNIALVAVWLVVSGLVIREHRRISASAAANAEA
jgi:AAA family ATP:ADP antiporter